MFSVAVPLATAGARRSFGHAAAMQRLGREAAAQQAFDEHMARHPGFEASHIVQRVLGGNPLVLEAWERLLASLKPIGMR